jgi:hypothetical protein
MLMSSSSSVNSSICAAELFPSPSLLSHHTDSQASDGVHISALGVVGATIEEEADKQKAAIDHEAFGFHHSRLGGIK